MSSFATELLFYAPLDPALLRREREKAREIRASNWWRQQIGKGVCYHCEKKFAREFLTMDHLIPLARGGKSTKNNIVVCCKQCNSHKKNLTVAELRMREIRLREQEQNGSVDSNELD